MTQAEAQRLIRLEKQIMHKGPLSLPNSGDTTRYELRSVFSDKDCFSVIFNRLSKIRTGKYTLLLRYGKDSGLIRVDVDGPNHTNPDGTVVPCPHIHLQKKDTGAWDAWASDIPAVFGRAEDRIETFRTFLQYCSVNNIASVEICEQSEMG